MPAALNALAGEALSSAVVDLCIRAGFHRAGIATLDDIERPESLDTWLAQGRHGEMQWLADTAAQRKRPRTLLEGARAAVMVADVYHTPGSDAQTPPVAQASGRIARYAGSDDYHTRLKRRLFAITDELRRAFAAHEFRVFTDTAPIAERELAQRAGLGWTGKHTLAIDPEIGSWFVLGGFVTTLELAVPETQRVVTDHCGTCTRCIDACPTDAITPYSVNASRCISYLTIEHRSMIDPRLSSSVGDWFAGCDICQEVCPHNRPRGSVEPAQGGRPSFDLLDVLSWDEQTRRARFAKSALKRISLGQAHRNAVINACNAIVDKRTNDADAQRLTQALEDLAWNAKAEPLARSTAREMLSRLEKRQ